MILAAGCQHDEIQRVEAPRGTWQEWCAAARYSLKLTKICCREIPSVPMRPPLSGRYMYGSYRGPARRRSTQRDASTSGALLGAAGGRGRDARRPR